MGIQKIIRTIGMLQGTKASMSLGKNQLRMARAKMCDPGKAIFDSTLGKLNKPNVDVAYKVSERGYSVGAVTIKDGQKALGNGAISVTGLGTEQSIIKYRLNIGENGKVAQVSGYLDNTENLSLDDVLINIMRKDGITSIKEQVGKAYGVKGAINEKEYAKMLDKLSGVPIATTLLDKVTGKANALTAKVQEKVRDFLAGKDILPKANKVAVKDNFEKKAVKVSDEYVENLLNKFKNKDFAHSAINEAKKTIRTPNGKEVPIEEFQKTINEYFASSAKTISDLAKNGKDEAAEKLLKELKNISDFSSKQGVEIKNDWTKWLGDAFFK